MARNATLRTYKFQSSSSFLPIATTSSIHTLRDTMKLRRNLVFCRREKKGFTRTRVWAAKFHHIGGFSKLVTSPSHWPAPFSQRGSAKYGFHSSVKPRTELQLLQIGCWHYNRQIVANSPGRQRVVNNKLFARRVVSLYDKPHRELTHQKTRYCSPAGVLSVVFALVQAPSSSS